MSGAVLKDIKDYAASVSEAMFRDMARLVAIPSVCGEALPGKPFGEGPARALAEGLKIAEELGLDTKNCENYIGYASVGGEGLPYLATVTHLDIVPVGTGWTGDPYTLREQEGYLMGRGILDDKGPSVLCLYALKYLKDKHIPLKYPVRALLGANEETGMEDVAYYLKNYPAPLFAFSPDADFPLIHGEKGICRGTLRSRCQAVSVKEIQAGEAFNAVPGFATALVETDKTPVSTDKVKAEKEGACWRLTAAGKGGHASMPQGTVNALGLLLQAMLDQQLVSGEEAEYFRACMKVHGASDGSLCGIAARDDYFTPLTCVSGMIWLEEGHFCQSLDCRYPTTTSAGVIEEKLQEALGEAVLVSMDSDSAPFYKDPSSPELQALLGAYRSVTGDMRPSFTIGGGTYAKDFPNAVGFGPEHDDRPRPGFAGPIHGADEAASREELTEALQVYLLALLKLEELEL